MLAASRVSSSVDISKSCFRGSGAIYQTDRLTLGRARINVEGSPEVIEKVVYKENENSLNTIHELQGRLKEALIRSVLLSTQVKYLSKKLETQTGQLSSHKVFENNFAFDNQRLKSEISRLTQLMADKEREIQFVREAEIRKSAIQTGELTVRMGLLTKENQRLQNAQIEKIGQMNNLNADLHKERQQRATLTLAQSTQSRLAELERLVQDKDRQIYGMKVSHSSALVEKEAIYTATMTKLSAAEHNIKLTEDRSKQITASNNETTSLKDLVSSLRSELNQRSNQVISLEKLNAEVSIFYPARVSAASDIEDYC